MASQTGTQTQCVRLQPLCVQAGCAHREGHLSSLPASCFHPVLRWDGGALEASLQSLRAGAAGRFRLCALPVLGGQALSW